MNITTHTVAGFTVLRIDDPVDVMTDIRSLKDVVDETLRSGHYNIAVVFHSDAMLRSSSMATLVLSAAVVNSHGGTFALVNPNEQILALVRLFGADAIMRIVADEKDLAEQDAAAG